jgi:acetyl esterase/lipase
MSPFMQLHNYIHPSAFEYHKKTYFTSMGLHQGRVLLWYLGITNYTSELCDEIVSESLIYQIEDLNLRKKYIDRMSPELIPKEFLESKSYYKTFMNISLNAFNLNFKLNENNLFKRDEYAADLAKKILSNDISPGLADDEQIKLLPKTYIVICEWDPLKDQELIYAQRLRNNGVQVRIAYYDNALHGTHFLSFLGFKRAQRIMDDMVEFLKENKFSL